MRLLFVHQNFPAQSNYLAAALGRNTAIEVLALGDAAAVGRRATLPGVRLAIDEFERGARPGAHPCPVDRQRFFAVTRGRIRRSEPTRSFRA